jgi:hypothetical protein
MALLNDATLAIVTWHDAHAESEWQDITTLDQQPYEVKTVGWIIPNAKPGHVVVVQSISTDDSCDGVLCIPVGMVVNTQVVTRNDIG